MTLGMPEHFALRAAGVDSALSQHLQIEAMKLAFADMAEFVAEAQAMRSVTATDLLDPAYLASRASPRWLA